jgi:hypothetical protein
LPTVLRSGPYRVFFYSDEGHEPPHVHVQRDDRVAKLWLDPVAVARHGGFPFRELTRIRTLVIEHRDRLLEAWNERFGP